MLKRLLLLVPVLTLGLRGDDLLSPAEALKKFTAPEGFRVDLIAAEPEVVQPIAFCWDGRGRLWVVEGRTYPGRKNNQPPGGETGRPNDAQLADIFGGDDRILIFADEDGDGKFESRKVFAEKLHLASGIEIGHGGVYVGAAPYLLHLADRDGDDRADGVPEILLDGWGWQDTHETLNSFVWGPDGWLYGCHGVFTHSNVGVPGTPREKRVPINCHYWRFHPVQRTFEAYASGTSNSWGFDFNESGDWFAEACVIPHFWHIIEGAYYLRQSNPLGHFNPYVYTNIETIADHLHYIGNTPHSGNGVSDEAGGGHAHCGLLIYNGHNFPSEYRGRAMMFNIHGQRINQEQLVPEGSGYVAKHLPDFVKANDRNFTGVALKVGPDGAVYFIDWYDPQKCHRTQPEVWDRSNGRIYRVRYETTWKPWRGDVAKLSGEEIAAGVAAGNGWLGRMVAQRNREAGQWPSAPRVAGVAWAQEAAGDARSRLKLASALQKLPLEERWPVAERLLAHGEDAGDHNLPQMYWYAVEPLVTADPERALVLAGKSAIPLVTQHIARRLAESDGGIDHLVRALGREKTGAGLVLLLKAARDGLKGRVGVAAPQGWDGAWQNMDDVVARRSDGKEHAGEIADLRNGLAVAFGDRRAFPGLRGQVRDRALEVERRIQALQVLAAGDDPELAVLVKELLDDPAMRLAALRALPRALR
jgi:putative membrane-bound dehydrogenase-like protein